MRTYSHPLPVKVIVYDGGTRKEVFVNIQISVDAELLAKTYAEKAYKNKSKKVIEAKGGLIIHALGESL